MLRALRQRSAFLFSCRSRTARRRRIRFLRLDRCRRHQTLVGWQYQSSPREHRVGYNLVVRIELEKIHPAPVRIQKGCDIIPAKRRDQVRVALDKRRGDDAILQTPLPDTISIRARKTVDKVVE